ncbi:unnamed protein product [Schistosoma turkestanicum]|nr:unnamed protein product [Schistosoma turkestanicum]
MKPQKRWMRQGCRHYNNFLDSAGEISNVLTHWNNIDDHTFYYYDMYTEYGACTVMNGSEPSAFLYFQLGDSLFKNITTLTLARNLNIIENGKVYEDTNDLSSLS